MNHVLGIDAAWTRTEPSGVALLAKDSVGGWRCLALAPSYSAFIGVSEGQAVDWEGDYRADEGFGQVLAAVSVIAECRPAVIAVDMPVSRKKINGRRLADHEISRAFGAAGCSTHSPSAVRPGPVGEALTDTCQAAGYEIATKATACGTNPSLMEVFPHPALLRLLDCDYRIPYKVSRSSRYWRGESVETRVGLLLEQFPRILAALNDRIGGIPLDLPAARSVPSLAFLKRYEDALDALVCAWAGVEYLEGRAEAFGDDDASIWVPGRSA